MTDSASPDNIFQQLYDCVQLGMEWSSEKLESVCPSEKRKKKCKPEQADDLDIGPPCAGRSASCYIKMQDPYAPCCCETKPQPPPCPPKSHRRRSREITCGCDLCKKDIEGKCCFLTTVFRNIAK
ncbi:hypothetical protein PUN28_014800 [Cardiocondyla obscurior]|uniref:Uncharacterized protein n=1 Tax=Cardiocondyla obscurior TaxID=286306 RepID=A0AAW2EYN4_9HYME